MRGLYAWEDDREKTLICETLPGRKVAAGKNRCTGEVSGMIGREAGWGNSLADYFAE